MKPSRPSDFSTDFREIWDMTSQIKRQIGEVDEKINQARRAAYLPMDVSSNNQVKQSSMNDGSALERRLLHDQDRRLAASSRWRPHDSDSNFPSTSSHSDHNVLYPTSPVSPFRPSERRKSDAVSPSVAEQSRLYTVGEILGTSPPVSSVQLNMLRHSAPGRPRSAVEQRRRPSGAEILYDAAQRSHEDKVLRRSLLVAEQGVYDAEGSRYFTKLQRPTSEPASTCGVRSANIDKRTSVQQLLMVTKGVATSSTTSPEATIRKPRIFSHLKRHASDVTQNGYEAVSSLPKQYDPLSRPTGIEAANGRNAHSRSSSSTGTSSVKNRVSGSLPASLSNPQPQSRGSERTSSLSSTVSAVSSSHVKKKQESVGSPKRRSSIRSSSTTGPQSSDGESSSDLENGGVSSKRTTAGSNSERMSKKQDGENERRRSSSSSSSESVVGAPKEGGLEPSANKRQRRIVSPPRGQRASKTNKDQRSDLNVHRRTRSYDVDVVRSYMEQKRRERKATASAQREQNDVRIDKRRTAHGYGQGEIEEYIRKQKSSENLLKKRAVERMQAAKMEQRRRMKEIIEEQKKRQHVAVTKMLGTEEIPVAVCKVEKTTNSPVTTPADDFDRRVQTIRAKYGLKKDQRNLQDGIETSLHGGESQESKRTNPANGLERADLLTARNGSMEPKTQASTATQISIRNNDDGGIVTRSEVDRHSTDQNVDEFNIVNTILRKHPYLRVTTLYMPGTVSDKRSCPDDRGRNGENADSEPHDGVSHRRTLGREGQKRTSATSSVDSGQISRNPVKKGTDVGDNEDRHSEHSMSSISGSGLSSVSSLTLSSKHNFTADASSEIERPRSLALSETNPTAGNGRLAENGEASPEQDISPMAASNLHLRASLNYMQALQYSLEQIEAAKDISSFVLAEQNATAAHDFMEAQLAARRWEQQLREARMATELQRMRAEMDRTTAAQELRLATEMTDNQRKLMETIMATNKHLAEQQNLNRREPSAARPADPERRSQFTDVLVAEVAASAATAATLAVLKRRTKRDGGSGGSLASSPTTSAGSSSLSSATQSSMSATGTKSSSNRAVAIIERVQEPQDASHGESVEDIVSKPIISPSDITSPESAPSVSSEISTHSKQRNSSTTGRESTAAVITEDAASRFNTSRSSQASPVMSEVGVQTTETPTVPSASQNTATVVDETLEIESRTGDTSTATASEIATVRSVSVPTGKDDVSTAGGYSSSTLETRTERRRSLELSPGSNSDETTPSSTATKESVRFGSGLKKRLDFGSQAADDNLSFSMSDMSEHESRVQALRSNLDERRRVADKLKQEYKRRVKTSLQNTEKSLLNQLNAYDSFIEKAENQLKELERIGTVASDKKFTRPRTPPKILSPRISSDQEVSSSPGRRSASSSPRSARASKTTTSGNQRSSSGSTAVVSSEIEINASDSMKTAASDNVTSDKSESQSSADSASSIPRIRRSLTTPGYASEIEKAGPVPSLQSVDATAQPERQQSVSTDTMVDSVVSEVLHEASVASPSSISRPSHGNDYGMDALKGTNNAVAKSFEDELGPEVDREDMLEKATTRAKLERTEAVVHSDSSESDRTGDLKRENASPIGVRAETTKHDEEAETNGQTSVRASEVGTDQPPSVTVTPNLSSRSETTTRSKSHQTHERSEAASGSSTVRGLDPIDDGEIKSERSSSSRVSSRIAGGSVSSAALTPRESGIEQTVNEHSSKQEAMKARGVKAVDMIVSAVLYDTVEHCVALWNGRVENFSLDKTRTDRENGGRPNWRKISDEQMHRLADVLVTDTITKALDDAIRSIIFLQKSRYSLDADENEGVISEKHFESIRRLVSHIDGEKSEHDGGQHSLGSSPRSTTTRSPRTPLSDRYNEAFRQPSHRKENQHESTKTAMVHDDTLELDEEQWIDDDFGFGDAEDKADSFSKKVGSPRSARLDLSRFTTDVFSTVPCTKEAVNSIVDVSVKALHGQRCMGELLSSSRKPPALYIAGKEDEISNDLELSLNRESDRIYRDFLFDLCQEIVGDVYSEDKGDKRASVIDNIDGDCPKWKKPPRLRLSAYAKLRPRNLADLQSVVRDAVSTNLDLQEPEKRSSNRSTRLKLVSRRKLDRVDELLLAEICGEEQDWTVYDDEELRVKFQLADGILDTVLGETLDICLRK